jgi:hypothetical protein
VCENTIGNLAGANLGVALNPISAFVADAATSVIFLIGSKQTRKWQFLKRLFLPFLANELFANHIQDKEDQTLGFYEAQVSISAFEIQDEIITDLLRPSSRGFDVSFSSEDGIAIQGLYKEHVQDETALRRAIMEACENRASHTLPPGGSIDTSSAIWEIELRQSEKGHLQGESFKTCRSKLIVVDLPAIDSLSSDTNDARAGVGGPLLHKSLIAFEDVIKKLSIPSQMSLAPFRSSKLTHYLSELIGGNAIVVGIGFIAQGEPENSRKTLELVNQLAQVVHYPVGGKELTEVLQGLLSKYKSMVLQLQDEIFLSSIDSRRNSNTNTIPDKQTPLKLKTANRDTGDLVKLPLSDIQQGGFETKNNDSISRKKYDDDIRSLQEQICEENNKNIAYKNETLRHNEDEARYNDRMKNIVNKRDKENNQQKLSNRNRELQQQQKYENALIEMDDENKKQFELLLLAKENEYKRTQDDKDDEYHLNFQIKENEYRNRYRDLQEQCNVANEDRIKLYEISELLHFKYATLQEEQAMQARELTQSGQIHTFIRVQRYVCVNVHVHAYVCKHIYVCID